MYFGSTFQYSTLSTGEFDKRVDKEMERIYKKNNVELAPDFIDNAFKEMIEMAKKGVAK